MCKIARAGEGLKNRKGFTLIELIVSMAIMSLLGASLFSLINTGGMSFQKIKNNYLTQNEARVAMSYITVKIRQNDIDGKIRLQSPNILEIANPAGGYWWIYSDSGKLKEESGLSNIGDTHNTLSDIADVDSVEISMDVKVIRITVYYASSKQLTEKVTLRTG